jgi:hypothetical protein
MNSFSTSCKNPSPFRRSKTSSVATTAAVTVGKTVAEAGAAEEEAVADGAAEADAAAVADKLRTRSARVLSPGV